MKRRALLLALVFLVGCVRDELAALEEQAVTAPWTAWALPVLCYHRFGPEKKGDAYQISTQRFDEQLKWLRSAGYQSVSLTQVAKAILGVKPQGWPAKPVMLTIDDGYKNSWSAGGPLLNKYGFKAVYFITTDMIDMGKNWLSFKDLKQMRSQGFEVGSHTRSHANLAKPKKNENPVAYKARMMDELRGSKEKLEKGLDEKITAIAYPYGAYNRKIEKWLKVAGYTQGFSVTRGHNRAGTRAYRIRRNILVGHPSLTAFKKIVQSRAIGNYQMFEGRVFVAGTKIGSLKYTEGPKTLYFPETVRVYLGSSDLGKNAQRTLKKDTSRVNVMLPDDLKPGFHLLKFSADKDGSHYESHSLFQIIRPEWASHFGLEKKP